MSLIQIIFLPTTLSEIAALARHCADDDILCMTMISTLFQFQFYIKFIIEKNCELIIFVTLLLLFFHSRTQLLCCQRKERELLIVLDLLFYIRDNHQF